MSKIAPWLLVVVSLNGCVQSDDESGSEGGPADTWNTFSDSDFTLAEELAGETAANITFTPAPGCTDVDAGNLDSCVAAAEDSIAATTDSLVCDILAGGTTIAAGVTVALGTAAGACALYGSVVVVGSGGTAAVAVVPACVAVGTGALYAAATTAALGAVWTLTCTNGFQAMMKKASEAVGEVVKRVYEGVEYVLRCNPQAYAASELQKAMFCGGRFLGVDYNGPPRSCTSNALSCSDVYLRLFNAEMCFRARQNIQRCWAQYADPNHISQLNDAATVRNVCAAKVVMTPPC